MADQKKPADKPEDQPEKPAKPRGITTRVTCTIPGAPAALNHKGQVIRFGQIKIGETYYCASEEISPAIADELYQLGVFTPFAQQATHGDAVDAAIEAAQQQPKAKAEVATIEQLRRDLEDHQRANLNLTADVQAARKVNEQLVADNDKLRTETAALRDACTKNSIPLPK